MKHRYLFLFLLSALVAVSCRENPASPESRSEIRFTSSIGEYAAKAGDTAFEEGDVIGLTAEEPVNAAGVKLTWNGTGFTPEVPLYWGRKQSAPTDFYAWFPYSFFGTETAPEVHADLPVELAADQSEAEVLSAQDLLVAAVSASPGETVHLGFRHLMSRLVLDVDSEMEIAGITVGGLQRQGTVRIADRSVLLQDTPGEGVLTPLAAGEGRYLLIAIPQSSRISVTITLSDGRDLVFSPEEALVLESGMSTLGTLKILADEAVAFSAEIVPWTEAGWADMTIPTPKSDPEKFFVVTRKGQSVEMELTDPGQLLYEAKINLSLGDGVIDPFRICNEDRSKEYVYNHADIAPEVWENLTRVKSAYQWTNPPLTYGNGSIMVQFNASVRQFRYSEFEYIGEGTLLESGFSIVLYLAAEEWQVSYYQVIDKACVYKVTNLMEHCPWIGYLDEGPGAGFIINALNPEKIYLDYNGTGSGIYFQSNPIIMISLVDELFGNELSNYGSFENGSFTFPVNGLAASLGSSFYRCNRFGHTTFTLPGYTRETLYVAGFDTMTWEARKIAGKPTCMFAITLYPDNTLLRIGIFEGSFASKDEIADTLEAAKNKAEGFQDYTFLPDITVQTDIELPLAGQYKVLAYTEGKDGSFKYRALNINYTPVE